VLPQVAGYTLQGDVMAAANSEATTPFVGSNVLNARTSAPLGWAAPAIVPNARSPNLLRRRQLG
jgi:hypothetical protein